MKKSILAITLAAVAALTIGSATMVFAAKACCVEPERFDCCATSAVSDCCK